MPADRSKRKPKPRSRPKPLLRADRPRPDAELLAFEDGGAAPKPNPNRPPPPPVPGVKWKRIDHFEPPGPPVRPSGGPARMQRRGDNAPRPEPVRERRVPNDPHVTTMHPDALAERAVEAIEDVETAVFREKKRADQALARWLKRRHELTLPDQRYLSECVFAALRWRGWIEPLRLSNPFERLLAALVLDSTKVHPVMRALARRCDRDPSRVGPVGDAPHWTARAEGLKRFIGGRLINADPWTLFPSWLRDTLPMPPGDGAVKTRYLELLHALQARPHLWIRIQGAEPATILKELGETGVKPWIHRRLEAAARLGPEVDIYHLPAFLRGQIEIQDLASQAVGHVCDPDPGERWWDACAGAGGKALHLASLMGGKGVVIATDLHEPRLKEAARRARRSPFRNISTKTWDGRHVVGKTGRYDGVLVDAPCSAIGTWRRNPDARWSLDSQAVSRLAELQGQILRVAAGGVKPGGVLAYSVCTLTRQETREVIESFLAERPDFRLDPFPHPLRPDETTDGTVQLWPQDADTDAMFIARMVRVRGEATTTKPAPADVPTDNPPDTAPDPT